MMVDLEELRNFFQFFILEREIDGGGGNEGSSGCVALRLWVLAPGFECKT
jgi:hypothetical protein